MRDSKVRISVIIPAFNAEGVIGRALHSLSLNSEPHDVIVVDDGSRTPIQEFLSPQANLIVLRSDKNLGVTGAANMGLEYALERGYEFIARLDSDDACSPNRLSEQIKYLDDNPDIMLVGSWGRVVSEKGDTLFFLNFPTSRDGIIKKCFKNMSFLHPSIMFRADAVRKFGVYSEEFPSAEDYEFTRRIAVGANVANIPKYLVEYTISANGISQKRRSQQLRSRLKIQIKYRNLRNIHFYIGVLMTISIWVMPVNLVTKIKSLMKFYEKN